MARPARPDRREDPGRRGARGARGPTPRAGRQTIRPLCGQAARLDCGRPDQDRLLSHGHRRAPARAREGQGRRPRERSAGTLPQGARQLDKLRRLCRVRAPRADRQAHGTGDRLGHARARALPQGRTLPSCRASTASRRLPPSSPRRLASCWPCSRPASRSAAAVTSSATPIRWRLWRTESPTSSNAPADRTDRRGQAGGARLKLGRGRRDSRAVRPRSIPTTKAPCPDRWSRSKRRTSTTRSGA